MLKIQRQLLTALLLVCLLPACNAQPQPDAVSSSVSKSGAAVSQAEPPKEEYVPIDPAVAEMAVLFREEFPKSFLKTEQMNALSQKNISAAATDIFMIGDTYFTFSLVLSSGENRITVPDLEVACSFSLNELGEPINRTYSWGQVVPLEEHIAIVSQKHIAFYDAKTLQKSDMALDMKEFEEKELRLVAFGFDESLGYFAAAEVNRADAFLFWDADGAFRETQYFTASDYSEHLLFDYINLPDYGPSQEAPIQGISAVNTVPPLLKLEDASYSYFYDPAQKAFLGAGSAVLQYEKEGSRILLYSIGSFNGTVSTIKGNKRHLALYYQDSRIQSAFFLNGEDIPYSYGYDSGESYDAPDFTWNPATKTLVSYCNLNDLQIELDFANKRSQLTFEINPERITRSDSNNISPGGRYAIRSANNFGFGDYAAHHLVLEDTQTGELTFLGHVGGGYGGYYRADFLSEDEVYFYDGERIHFFYTATGQPSTRVLDFPLGGGIIDGKERILLSFAYDSNGYALVYMDYDSKQERQNDQYNELLACEYQVALLDASGKVTETFSTGMRVQSTPFGVCYVNTSLSGDRLHFDVLDRKSESILKGQIDIASKTFIPAGSEKE